ncbi:CRIB domain-containing protein RIC4-like isoform X2 [Ananas comosus]|uniref:CRIB domain-containing protein RIC4-like isoform X2 n=1 Tax=Ananas comosus TaxID=4615 RepID=A0A6P5EET4_ANACO|nr:CRIB domain-containing protein RIC4-like isoform X2 [Ananas comosus]
MMRDRRMDRFVVLPFSVGCVSQSSVSVLHTQPKNTQLGPIPPLQSKESPHNSGGGDQKPRSAVRLLALPKPSISAGLQKLIRGFKMGLSQLFVVYEEDGDGGGGGDEEEEEREMVIGFPTDVQHVAHIGLDGVSSMKSSSSSSSSSRSPNEFLFLPPPHNSLSLPSPHPMVP